MSDIKTKIVDAYIDYISLNAEKPKSVYAFCKGQEVDEASFYEHFSNFEVLEKSIWADMFRRVVEAIEADPVFEEYNTKERYLAFCFTLVEHLKKHLSFYRNSVKGIDLMHATNNPVIKAIQSEKSFIQGLIRTGLENEEIKTPSIMTQPLAKLFQGHIAFTIRYFMTDDSTGFTQTDQAIEKSVRLLFDAVENSLLDSVIDFTKFMGKTVFS